MGWEQYLSAETLYNTSSSELEQIKQDLQREMERQNEKFVEYKKMIKHEFEQVFLWYQQHYNKPEWLEGFANGFAIKLEKTESIADLVKVIEQITRNADIPTKLCDMLKSKYTRLCIAGKLPRDYIIQIRPLIILEVQQSYLEFLDKVNGIFGRAKATQVEVFELLIRKLSTSENEEEAKQFIQEAINIARSFQEIKSTLFDQIGNKHLYSIVAKLSLEMEKKGYINSVLVLNFDISSLQQAIDIANAQIILKKLNQQEQREQLILAHELSLALLKTGCVESKEIETFLDEYDGSLKQLSNVLYANDYHGLMALHQAYIKSWLDITHASLEKIQNNRGKQKKRWANFHLRILKARKNLQQQGYLPEDFVLDQQYLIMDRFESYIHTAYRNSFWRLGDNRLDQIDLLRQQLKNVNSAAQAARIIQIAIEDIQQDHQEKSFGFNMAFVKRKSRAAGALQALKRDCERDKLLPKITMRQASDVEQHLAKAVEEYFSADILFSNREHRGIVRRLFSAIRLVEDQIYEEKILFIDGQQLIADLLLHAVNEANKINNHNYFVNRLLNFLGGRTNPAFVEYLKRAQTELLITKKLVESYRHVVWPIVKDKLSETIVLYKNELSPEVEENKEIGVREANELLVQMQDATNAEHACYLLAYGIRSLRTGFPLLGHKLEETYQLLRKDGVLPAIPQTEFSETIKRQIKQQTREITELRSRLCKVS